MFKEGDFHRLRIQDIEDMLLLLVQGKLTNLNIEERLAFNVSLKMLTRSVVIQRRVEDLQLGIESYQKKLNLTKPDTYKSNLRIRDAYTPYSDPKGFIYENKDKKNRLMCIDELHKFSDGTLDDVRTALNDHLKGIGMEFNTTAGNPVKKILLKLNLSDHRLFKDGGGGGRRTDARRGRGGGQGNADNSDIGNNCNNDGIGNIYRNLKIAAMIAQQLQDLLPTIVTQINNGTNNQGNSNGGSGEDNTNWENNEEGRGHGNPRDGGNNNNKNRCSYKEFLACKPKEFDGKGGAITYTRWVEKMELVIDMRNYAINQRVKYDVGSLTRKALTWWNTQRPEWILKVEGLTDDAARIRLLKRSSEKRKEIGKTGKQEDARSNNKRARTGKGFVATDSGKKEYKGLHPKCTKCSYHHQETTRCRTCFNCNQSGHIAKDCRTIAKWVTPVNAINSANKPRVCYECGSSDHFRNTCPDLNKTLGQVQSNPNQALAIGGNNFNYRNNGNQARGRAFALGANEGQ
ncbi:reverse transcriptase domain-containing protein [Tanacetum coccineum]|uniref:Reverse transcriptase domain-containing protein n=1 Tax=Tanacetum coccineum TaxID=301880 RepID=A0ABQ4ZLH4_9ASTR